MAKRATWFKVHLSQRATIKSLSNEAVGEALKLAMDYFSTGEEQECVNPLATILYNGFVESISEALNDYAAAVEGGKKSAQMRESMKNNISPTLNLLNPPKPP